MNSAMNLKHTSVNKWWVVSELLIGSTGNLLEAEAAFYQAQACLFDVEAQEQARWRCEAEAAGGGVHSGQLPVVARGATDIQLGETALHHRARHLAGGAQVKYQPDLPNELFLKFRKITLLQTWIIIISLGWVWANFQFCELKMLGACKKLNLFILYRPIPIVRFKTKAL